MRIWTIVMPDNEKQTWAETFQARWSRRFPNVDKDGFVRLGGFPYVTDPERMIREYYHDRRKAGMAAFLGFLVGSITMFFAVEWGIALIVIGLVAAFVLGAPRKEDIEQVWRYKEPDPLNLNDKSLSPGSIGITGDTIRTYARSEHLKRLVQPDTNLMLIVLFILIVSIAAGAVGYSVGLQNGGAP